MSFIVLEGVDGSGKSTAINSLKKYLENKDIPLVQLFEPTSDESGQRIRNLLRGSDLPDKDMLLDMFIQDRKNDVENNVLPALSSGKVVIMDRYYYSNAAYQGAMGIDVKHILEMNHKENFPKPDRVYLLDVDPDTSLSRVQGRIEDDKSERECFEKRDFLQKVRDNYLSMVDDSFCIIDASRSPEDVFSDLILDFEKNIIKAI